MQKLEKAAASVEQLRARNDLFEVSSVYWQTFWESQNPSLLHRWKVSCGTRHLGVAGQPNRQSRGGAKILRSVEAEYSEISSELRKVDGDRTQGVMAGFAAQKEFARCQDRLVPLAKYLELQTEGQPQPDWNWLHKVIAWRDLFERLRGQQKLDVDSPLWLKLREGLNNHQATMKNVYEALQALFEGYVEHAGHLS